MTLFWRAFYMICGFYNCNVQCLHIEKLNLKAIKPTTKTRKKIGRFVKTIYLEFAINFCKSHRCCIFKCSICFSKTCKCPHYYLFQKYFQKKEKTRKWICRFLFVAWSDRMGKKRVLFLSFSLCLFF